MSAEVDGLQIALAPSAAMAMCDLAMANSLALAMANAVASQQRGQVVCETAVSIVLAKILTAAAKPPSKS
ncbi:RebB family R body protein [Bordetella genomosp. 13]|uniref:RebB family R body protein n=1 Tax=Bordetella genomosp. 13 TaxID=463040 RepID=UPI0011A8A037|nr:RebB family R body protein [Bordetella genomosp. 13]